MKKTFFLLIVVLMLGDCTSVIEKAGRTIDGSASAEKKVSVYRASKKNGGTEDIAVTLIKNKTLEQSVLITLDKYPMMRLRGSMPDENGEFLSIHLNTLQAAFTAGMNTQWKYWDQAPCL